MSLLDFIVLLIVAGVTGSIGQAIAGFPGAGALRRLPLVLPARCSVFG